MTGTSRLSARIMEAVGDVVAGVEPLRTSVGIAIFPDDGVIVSDLLDAADQRLLVSKRVRPGARADRRAA